MTAKAQPFAAKPATIAVTDAQRAVLREVAEEWVRRDAEEPPIRAPDRQVGAAGEAPVAAFFFARFADHGEWGVLARFRSPDGGSPALVLDGTPEARMQRRLACLRAIGLLCQEVVRLDGEVLR